MEDIQERISERNYNFLQKLQDYIGCKLIFFGSIKRCDFVKNYSDIDIAIITDNIQDTIVKLKFFLDIDNRKIRKIVQKFPKNNDIVNGYKTNYNDYDNDLSIEIVVYDEKYRKHVMESINNVNNFPFYITYILLIIKLFYYKLNFISSATYKWIKDIIIEAYLNQGLHDNFIAIKI
jgi:predicted nucleotidyltransferase